MGVLDDITSHLYAYKVKNRLSKHKVIRKTVPLDQAKHIGILFNADRPENIVLINRFAEQLKEGNRKIDLLGFINRKSTESGETAVSNFKWFDKKGVNWYGVPTAKEGLDFINTKFDILINGWLEPTRPLEYISTFSQASWRISPHFEGKDELAEFQISLKEGKQDLNHYFDQVDHFVRTISN
ncbi:MAG: hypothetical protein ACI959_000351 [Limisphaerales bacterium]|jgi:hypothetical protein